MKVCVCRAVSDRRIVECIRQGARTLEAVGAACGAGTRCGMCVPEILERLEEEEEQAGTSRPCAPCEAAA